VSPSVKLVLIKTHLGEQEEGLNEIIYFKIILLLIYSALQPPLFILALFLELTSHLPTSGPLHLLFSMPGIFP
jgi:hypothetical protein